MAINRDKPDRWKIDIALSVDLYNDWFIKFAPEAFRQVRVKTTEDVEMTLKATGNLTNIHPDVLRKNPGVLPTLRMSTCPPLARDRLIGLAGVSKNLVQCMEKDQSLPSRIGSERLNVELKKIGLLIEKLADRDIFPWLNENQTPDKADIHRASTIIADRLCGATADPIIRNAQESRQLHKIAEWLEVRNYHFLQLGRGVRFNDIPPGTYSFHVNVPAKLENTDQTVNISVDVVIMRQRAKSGDFPLFIEAKSAGDFTNVISDAKKKPKKLSNYTKPMETKLIIPSFFLDISILAT